MRLLTDIAHLHSRRDAPCNDPLFDTRRVPSGGRIIFVFFFPAGTAACEYRIVGGTITTTAPSGATTVFGPMTQSAIQTFKMLPYSAPVYPDPLSAFQTLEANRQNKVRFVEVRAAAGKCLAFRDLWVIDSATYSNVALFKPVTGSPQTNADGFGVYSLEMGNNGEVSFDTNGGDMVNTAACDGTGYWRVDLGESQTIFLKRPFFGPHIIF